ncbi:hypothetical protein GF336_04560 [Candidatus Woesearchaeota archaeon]|nr:hypothetical protein [Candidatus Woesearchaeota archaeon]
MGTILSSKTTKEGDIVYEILVDYEESLQLKGRVKNVHVFSEDVADIKTNLSGRGKNEATKYFLIPTSLRKNIKLTDKVKCQKLETESKNIFVYVVDKLRF